MQPSSLPSQKESTLGDRRCESCRPIRTLLDTCSQKLKAKMNTPNGRKEIEKMFGNPANGNGTLNEAWEGANIRKVAPPDGWQLFYQDDNGLIPVSGIRMHKLLEDVFHSVRFFLGKNRCEPWMP